MGLYVDIQNVLDLNEPLQEGRSDKFPQQLAILADCTITIIYDFLCECPSTVGLLVGRENTQTHVYRVRKHIHDVLHERPSTVSLVVGSEITHTQVCRVREHIHDVWRKL